MSIIQVNQLKRKIEETYSALIDVSDVVREQDLKNCFLTRAYAAYALQVLANIEPTIASLCITDTFNDNGIDAIYYNSQFNELWIVQSKWIKNGNGEPQLGDVSKFIQGIKDLIELKFDRFNDKITSRKEEIEEALSDIRIRIKIVLAYTGSDVLADPSKRIIDDLLEVINEASDVMEFHRFPLKQAIQSLVSSMEGLPISKDIQIKNWEKIDNPYNAVLGIIDGITLAQLWVENRVKLFSENIREFNGNSSVNIDIRNTALEEPEHFLYYNNGITILCDNIIKQVAGGADHSFGNFHIENMKIVNGAQTVGSLGEAYRINPEAVAKTNIFTKIISLKNCPTNFGDEVTKKTNTQNKIEKRDFVSLDAQHERLKIDLSLDNIVYQIKRGDTVLKTNNSCNVEELITAVACSLADENIAITTKREVGKLWENINEKPYTDIINPSLSALKAWRCVVIMRLLASFIKEKEKVTTGREKACYIHSNRFVLHLILTNLSTQVLTDASYNFKKFCDEELNTIFNSYEGLLFRIVEEKYSTSLMHQIFRNYTKSRDIKSIFQERINS